MYADEFWTKRPTHHVVHIDVVVNVEQIGPPAPTAWVFVDTDPGGPVQTGAKFVKQSGVETNHHRVSRRQPDGSRGSRNLTRGTVSRGNADEKYI